MSARAHDRPATRLPPAGATALADERLVRYDQIGRGRSDVVTDTKIPLASARMARAALDLQSGFTWMFPSSVARRIGKSGVAAQWPSAVSTCLPSPGKNTRLAGVAGYHRG